MSSEDAYDCPLWPDNPSYCDVVITIRRIVASLSLVGCLFIIGAVLLFKKYRVLPQRLILALSVAAFLDSISYLMGDIEHENSGTCKFQAFWLSWFDWSVLAWVCCITFNLYQSIIKQVVQKHMEKWYHVVCWGVTFVIATIPLMNDSYGPASVWCWITEDHQALRFILWYVPLFVLIAGLAVVYTYITVKVNRQTKTWQGSYDAGVEAEKELMREHIKPLRLYPLIFLVCSAFGLVNRIQNAANPGNPVFGLMLLHSIFAPLQGALNAVAYGMDKETMQRCNWASVKVALARRNDQAIVQEWPGPTGSSSGRGSSSSSSSSSAQRSSSDASGGSVSSDAALTDAHGLTAVAI